MPGIGLEYRFPFVGTIGTSGTQTIEPIAQIIARPNETLIGKVPNEDAQSLVFEDTSLFEWNKFTGYDRAEGGVRANVGVQYTITGANDFYANVLFGQSYQVAGRNSFSQPDLVHTGLDSGLEFWELGLYRPLPDLSEHELLLRDPWAVRPERFRVEPA